jgi:hypothetical protein
MNIPYGDSLFQIENFIVVGPDGRKIRTCQLQLRKKLQAIEECKLRRRRLDIDKREKEEKLQTAEGYEKERLQIDLDEIQYKLESEIELIEDCVIEARYYQGIIYSLPKMTREEFEAEEKGYWTGRLLNDARREISTSGRVEKGTLESIEKIGLKLGRDEKNNLIVMEERNDLLPDSNA